MFKKLFLILIVLAVSHTLFSENVNRAVDDQDLISIAKEQGVIRVLVKVDVPNLVRLTDVSNKFKTGNLKKISRYAMADADLELSLEIRKSVDSVLYNIRNSPYKLKHIFKTVPFISMEVNENTLKSLVNDPNVLKIIQDKPLPLQKIYKNRKTINTDISKPMLLQSIGLIGADIAWDYGITGQGWYVAVLDTGIRSTHEMFTGKNIIEACFALGKDWGDEVGDCPNGKTEMVGPDSAVHSTHQVHGYDHGTHVSGIAAGNNQKNVYGVAKDSGIIAVQVFSYFPDSDDVMSWGSDQLKGLEYVYSLRGTYNIAAANMSLGGESYSTFCDGNFLKPIIDNLKATGIATVIASGNDGYCNSISSPACISSAVSVGGTNKSGNEYYGSNYKEGMVDLHAPGVSIRSAIGTGDTNYSSWNGTSMATPHVAGAWALFKQLKSELSVDELLTKLMKNRSNIISRCEFSELKMQIDVKKTIEEYMAFFPPKNLAISQVRNKSLIQLEYLNVLTWEVNPLNDNNIVVGYKIYELVDGNNVFIDQVNSSTFQYYHRKQNKREGKVYRMTSLDDKGVESPPIGFALEFGVTTN